MKHNKLRKKAAVEMPARTVVIIIIAVVMLVLTIIFIKTMFGKGAARFEEQMGAFANPPIAAIRSPLDKGEYLKGSPLSFDASTSYDLSSEITDYYWDFDGDGDVDSEEMTATKTYSAEGRYTVKLKVLNKEGAVGEATATITVTAKNKKNDAKYAGNPLFLVSDASHDDILRLIPIAVWKDVDSDLITGNPLAVYAGSITSPIAYNIMDSYGKDTAYIFGTGAASDDSHTIIVQTPVDDYYFSYWDTYGRVVLVDPGSGHKLISALFAAYINAPLIFINFDNRENYFPSIENKKAYIIGTLDPRIVGDINIKSISTQRYSNQELYNNPNINGFAALTSMPSVVPTS